ncbi:hypothetical protein GPECTOR_50g570 [Gonium pectorale]|uniref:Phospholipid scramblase n=1 Tax=Gonium pectorale TaxID=33097 RepID=A0A150G7F6_GONPE|nr:hypothetical protein GPECTOR_50g570 [Gonium pectorale]|eukprot:KXZ45777.1 hypothetical protein GPECTOR_50g570 [Gonium pectorale]
MGQKGIMKARREKQAPPPARREAPAAPELQQAPEAGPPVDDRLQPPPDAALIAAGATAVTPQEGRASEAQISAALDHPALIVTRPIEWGTVIFGYEQANKYTVYDETGRVVALVAEDYGGLGKEVGRQLLRTRRSFTSTVFSADGTQVLFRLRRPAYLISSTMFVEDGAGQVLGEIQQRWHALRRNYDLYMDKSQFAAISGTFLAWEFELKDSAGGTLALVDRNFQGFAKELFTDAGKYVIHFGYQGAQLQQHMEQQAQAQLQAQQQQQQHQQQQPQLTAASGSQPAAAGQVASAPTPTPTPSPAAPETAAPAAAPSAAPSTVVPAAAGAQPPSVTAMAVARTDVAVIPTQSGNQLVVARPLGLSERMVALACALTIDYDYFSQHSHSGGGIMSPMFYPMPGGGATPVPAEGAPGGGDVPAAGAAGAAQGAVGEAPLGGGYGRQMGGEAASGAAPEGGFPQQDGFDSGQAWGEQGSGDGEMKWDLGGDAGGAVGGGEEGGGVIMGVVRSLWELFGGGD